MNGICLPCLVVQDQGNLPTSCNRPRTNNSWNCQCDNFEPHEVWITELLRMYGLKDRKMASLSNPVLSGDSMSVMQSDLPTLPHVSITVSYNCQLHSFSMLVTEITLWWWRMHVCQYIYISSVSHLSLYIHVICCPKFFGSTFLFGLTVPQHCTVSVLFLLLLL